MMSVSMMMIVKMLIEMMMMASMMVVMMMMILMMIVMMMRYTYIVSVTCISGFSNRYKRIDVK